MVKRLLFFISFVFFTISSSASRTSVYLSRCPIDDVTEGNMVKRTLAQPLCVWQEQNYIYIPQGNDMHCSLLDGEDIVYESVVPASGMIVFPVGLQGQYTLLIQLSGVSYIGEIYL